MNSPIWATGAMKCNLNDYAPEGTPMHQIIDDLASDNEYFAEKFLESYGMMISNGYTESELTDGPQNGWLGHSTISCGVRFSQYFEIGQNKFHSGDWCDLMI